VKPTPDHSRIFTDLAHSTGGEILDVFGPTVEFLTWSKGFGEQFCVIRGVIPPGVTVPLHSHHDTEDFYIVCGTQQVLVPGTDGLEWRDANAGEYVRVSGGVPHAHRNISDQPAVDLIITTPRMGRFFREVGDPLGTSANQPTAQRLRHFMNMATKYGMQLGTPEENAVVGIDVPTFTDTSVK
jgi:quercetin dioxygenase-like cupin family protein